MSLGQHITLMAFLEYKEHAMQKDPSGNVAWEVYVDNPRQETY